MKPMIWHPEEKDAKIRQYLNEVNHAPYPTIVTVCVFAFCALTLFFLLGSF